MHQIIETANENVIKISTLPLRWDNVEKKRYLTLLKGILIILRLEDDVENVFKRAVELMAIKVHNDVVCPRLNPKDFCAYGLAIPWKLEYVINDLLVSPTPNEYVKEIFAYSVLTKENVDISIYTTLGYTRFMPQRTTNNLLLGWKDYEKR